MEDAVILAAVRSPMGRAHKGSFVYTRIDDIAAQVVIGLLKRIPELDANKVEDILVGCSMPEGEQGLNVARNIGFLAGLPVACGGVTVNRFCASSLEAINMAAQSAMCGNGDLFVAGGIESMTHIPMGGFNPSLNEKLMRPDAPNAYIGMGATAENLARIYNISREEQDRFSLMSHRKAVAAQQQGKFEDEIIPVEAVMADGSKKIISKDEGPRTDTSMEALSKLNPAFQEGGTVTAGNSSPLTDGSAFALVSSKSFAKKNKIKPLAVIRAMAVSGVDPAVMGKGPIFAVPKALKRAKMKLSDIDLIELNEAFAAQSLAVIRELGFDETKLNIHGGAIALGHPLGASGARLVATLIHAMKEKDVSVGLATMCVGGGQGVATIVERV
jgi:acetyl-CoA acetyltransferase family protein